MALAVRPVADDDAGGLVQLDDGLSEEASWAAG